MSLKNRIVFVGLFSMLAGCLSEYSGEPPPGDQLIYPVGLITTANDDFLIVVNSNFDLQYNAGTVVALSLEKVRAIIETGGSPDWLSNDGTFLFIPDTELIDPNDTIRIGSFASDIALTPDRDRALVPVRGGAERAIVILDIDESKTNGKVLSCGEGNDLTCDRDHRVTSNEEVTLPIEPYEVASMVYTRENAEGVPLSITVGFATHLYSGDVSAFVIENDGRLAPELFSVAREVVPGASGIEVRPDPENANNNTIYVSGRSNADKFISVMKLITGTDWGTYTNKPYFGSVGQIGLAGDLYAGTDARGIAVTPAGDTAFVVTRTPEALLKIDLSSEELIDMTTLGTDPSVVQLYEDETTGRIFVFVLCFKSNQVYIVDAATMQVWVRSTGVGPHAITFDHRSKWAFIANFRESTISVIEATPPFDHIRVGNSDTKIRLGRPRLPEK